MFLRLKVVSLTLFTYYLKFMTDKLQVWDDELARVAQKWADQCANVDYKEDYKRKDPHLFHDPHPQRKVGKISKFK